MYDVVIVGAGPIGLSIAIAASRRRLNYLVLEKGVLVNSIHNFPTHMTFFSTGPEAEIGDIPFVSSALKPTRQEALQYYRRVATHYDLKIRFHANVKEIIKVADHFKIQILPDQMLEAKRVVLATGYYDNPNRLGIPGEDLPKVSHFYKESHPYFRKKVLIVGGRNSAAEAALEIFRSGGEVTLVHRGSGFDDKTKYWVKPDINNRIARGEITAYFNSRVLCINPSAVNVLVEEEREISVENDFVLALIGYHPNTTLMRSAGVKVNETTLAPEHNKETLETNVAGFFVAGALTVGNEANRIFIENGRVHGEMIVTAIEKSLK